MVTVIHGSRRSTRSAITNRLPQRTVAPVQLPSGAVCSSFPGWAIAAVVPLWTISTCSPQSSTGWRKALRRNSSSPPVTHSPGAAARCVRIQSTHSTRAAVTRRTRAASDANDKRFHGSFEAMSRRRVRLAATAAALFIVAALGAAAQLAPGQAIPAATAGGRPFVSPIFGDNMVLQRGKPNAIWGWSDPGDTIRVTIGAHSATSVAGSDGRWLARIQPPKAGGPYTVTIAGRRTVELHNVLVGDVWLCGGQSNMALTLRFTRNADEEIKSANYPNIRFFTVGGRPAYRRVDVIEGKWNVVSPESAASISAAGYYFARKLHQEIHVPIGLVVDAVGGTPAESWTSADALRPLHDFDVPLAELDRLKTENAPEYGNYVMHWYDRYDAGQKNNWAAADFDDSTWKPVSIPGGFAEVGVPDTPAVVWFRREITLPDPLPAGRAVVRL